MTSPRRLATLGCVGAVTALALPGAASAATFTSIKPCYVSLPGPNPVVEQIRLAGTGFAPGVPADIDVDGSRAITGAPVDGAGVLGGADPATPIQAPSPFVSSKDRSFQIVALQNGAPVATATAQATALNVGLSPRRSRPSRKVTFRGRGFTGAGKVYAHYRYKGRTRKTVTFTPQGPCGTFTTKKRQIPVSNPGTGTWTVQFDQQKKYSSTPSSVFVRLTILVSRTVRLNRAAAATGEARTGGARVVAAGLGRR